MDPVFPNTHVLFWHRSLEGTARWGPSSTTCRTGSRGREPNGRRRAEPFPSCTLPAPYGASPLPCRQRQHGHTGKASEPGVHLPQHRRKYSRKTGVNIEVTGLCVHSMQATAATNALSIEADIAKVHEWLGHATVSTPPLHDPRKTRPEHSPTFHMKY